MKKKIILLVLCAVLLLIFTSSGFGGFDPNYMEREEGDPWEHKLAPELDDNQNLNLVLLVVHSDLHLLFMFQSKVENFSDLGGSMGQKLDYSREHNCLNENEAKSKK